ncbi:MAG TPA: PilZ domain-containing protein [Terriglobales bacterium]|jgi:hypothetical protein|nr:PilZ domain-containing protein [Terriglobales bacterium]
MLQQANPAIDMMRNGFDRRRSSMRVHMAIPAEVFIPEISTERHTALVRDVSLSGAFLYSSFTPKVGDPITVHFALPFLGRSVRVTCHCVVVRVEQSRHGGATGFATQFRHHDVSVIH